MRFRSTTPRADGCLTGAGLAFSLLLRPLCRSWSEWLAAVGTISVVLCLILGGVGVASGVLQHLRVRTERARAAAVLRRLGEQETEQGARLIAEAEALTVAGASIHAAADGDPLTTARVHAASLAAALRSRLGSDDSAVGALDYILRVLDVGLVQFAAPLPPAEEGAHLAALTAACVRLRDRLRGGGWPGEAIRLGGNPLVLISDHVCDVIDHGRLIYAAALGD